MAEGLLVKEGNKAASFKEVFSLPFFALNTHFYLPLLSKNNFILILFPSDQFSIAFLAYFCDYNKDTKTATEHLFCSCHLSNTFIIMNANSDES